MGSFNEKEGAYLELLREYTSIYFDLDVVVLPALSFDKNDLSPRLNPYTQHGQISADDVQSKLKSSIPDDAFFVLAITLEDLYPRSEVFVFGQSSYLDRVGVASFARYDPLFFGEKRDENFEKTRLRRSCNVIVHEIAHGFGLSHCIYYRCILNGTINLKETDERPMYLCPVCLHKMHVAIKLDFVKHYQRLLEFCEKAGFEEEAGWIKNHLKKIMGT
jgi:archaemetzincin